MKIDATFKKNYPELSKWVTNELPKVKSKTKVWKAFLKYSELNDAKAKAALKAGTDPTLKSRKMPGANGEFEGGKFPNSVFLAEQICSRFAKDYKNKKTTAKMALLVESTILHEMVHWGDWKDGVDQTGEEGKKFEKEAYGKDINRYW